MPDAIPFGERLSVRLSPEEADQAVRASLARQGFGILTEIDMRATLKKKLDVDFRPYVILGACNPVLSRQALAADLTAGLLLPCNVVVYADDAPGRSIVAVVDPVALLPPTAPDGLRSVALEARRLLRLALRGLGVDPVASASP